MYRCTRFYVCFFVTLYCVAGASAADSVPPGDKPRSALAIHKEVPIDPYLPTPPQPPRGQRGRTRWARGPYVSIQVNTDELGYNIVGDAANEPSIAIDPTDPNRIVIGWRQFDNVSSNFRQSGWGYTHDRGLSWTFPGSLTPGVFGSDPVLASDSNGAFYYVSINYDMMRLHRSFDGGVTWDDPPIVIVPGFHDKEWMAIDRTGGPGDGHIYLAWTDTNQFTRSTDGGVTFMDPIPAPISSTFWGTLSVGPGGELYLADRTFTVVRSTNAQDSGVSPVFDLVRQVDIGGSIGGGGPNPGGLVGQVWVATDHSDGPTRGNVYLLVSVNPPGPDPLDVMFARSTDGGLNWSSPVRVNDDPTDNGAWQWFGTMSVAPNGRIDAIWNDTRHDPGGFRSELHYAYSIDAGQTWSANEALSPPFDPHVGWPNQNKIGDYYDSISDDWGANIAYAATFNGEQDVYFLRTGPPDCNGNGIPDDEDIAEGTSLDCNANSIPDECDPDCNDNEVPDACDIADATSPDENGNGIPDECELRLFVDDDALGGGDGLSWAGAFDDLQEALSAAAGLPREVIDMRVAGGIYRPAGPGGDRTATFQLISSVTISGGYAGVGAPDPDQRNIAVYETILSGDFNGDDGPDYENNEENAYHVVTGGWTDATAGLDGLTITAGNANGTANPARQDRGAGMYNNQGSPTVASCRFTENWARSGAGMLNEAHSSPTLSDCVFSRNTAELSSGGLGNVESSNPTLTDCAFNGNSAGIIGGGMVNTDGSPTLTNCAFNGNSARLGGGMENFSVLPDSDSTNPTLTNCTFTGNSADVSGGGMGNYGGSPTLTNCVFNGNSAEEYGGAMYNAYGPAILVNCTFTENSAPNGRALACDSLSTTTAALGNCILSNGGGEIWNNDRSTVTVTYSNVQGGWPGEGNIDADPLFIDADGPDDIPGNEDDDLRLSFGSPCIDAADNTAVLADSPDLDEDGDTSERIPLDVTGQPRFMDDPDTEDTGVPDPPVYVAVVDMGAHESLGAPCLDDAECDDGEACTEDACDPVAGVCVSTYHRRLFGDVVPFEAIVPPCTDEDRMVLGDGFANMLDVFCAFNAFNGGSPYTECPCADVAPCGGDSFVNMQDVFAIFNVFNDKPACPDPCP